MLQAQVARTDREKYGGSEPHSNTSTSGDNKLQPSTDTSGTLGQEDEEHLGNDVEREA